MFGPDDEIRKKCISMQALLSFNNLTVTVVEEGKEKKIVYGASFDVQPHSICALVGGSGSGKTTTALAAMRLLSSGVEVTGGQIVFDGQEIFKLTEERVRSLRGKGIGMVFQEPLYAFNPIFSIAEQIDEVLLVHTPLPKDKRQKKILELLDTVGIQEPKRVAGNYPHQLSGGMRQRAMIAQALAGNPKLMIADEPTSNLDVTLQAKIMDLFRKLKKDFGLSILLISHDLGMVRHMAEDIVVMDRGRVVEKGKTPDVISRPQHEYTQQLMDAFGD